MRFTVKGKSKVKLMNLYLPGFNRSSRSSDVLGASSDSGSEPQIDGVTPGTCHHETGTNLVASMMIGCSVSRLGDGSPANPGSVALRITRPVRTRMNTGNHCRIVTLWSMETRAS